MRPCGVPWQRRYRPRQFCDTGNSWVEPLPPKTRLYDPAVWYVGPSLWFPRRRMRTCDTRGDTPSSEPLRWFRGLSLAHGLRNKSDFTQFARNRSLNNPITSHLFFLQYYIPFPSKMIFKNLMFELLSWIN